MLVMHSPGRERERQTSQIRYKALPFLRNQQHTQTALLLLGSKNIHSIWMLQRILYSWTTFLIAYCVIDIIKETYANKMSDLGKIDEVDECTLIKKLYQVNISIHNLS